MEREYILQTVLSIIVVYLIFLVSSMQTELKQQRELLLSQSEAIKSQQKLLIKYKE